MDTGVTLPAALTCVCIGPVTARALAARSAAPFLTASGISAESAVQGCAGPPLCGVRQVIAPARGTALCGDGQPLEDGADVLCNADGLGLEFPGDVGVRLVHTRVGGQRVLLCHLPEGVFDDDRGVSAHPQF